jgi:hypothetical protein
MKPLSGPAAALTGIVVSVVTCSAALAQQPTGPQGYPYGPGMMGWGDGTAWSWAPCS